MTNIIGTISPTEHTQEKCSGQIRIVLDKGNERLQQLWHVTTFKPGLAADMRQEWRDVEILEMT